MTDPVTSSESIAWTPTSGEETSYTVESFQSYPSAPSSAKNIQKTHEDGKFVLRYTLLTGTASATYTITGSTSQEPIGTHPMFGSDGSYSIDADEWKKWKLWESSYPGCQRKADHGGARWGRGASDGHTSIAAQCSGTAGGSHDHGR